MLDNRAIAATEGVGLVLGSPEKAAENPLFQADKPWENSLNNLYPNIVFDPADRLFKLWYKCVLADKDVIADMKPPRLTHDVGWYLCYATSTNGVTWEKPELGAIDHGGSTRNNIVVRDAPNVGVFRDPHASKNERFKLVSDVGLGNIQLRTSQNGLNWSEPIIPTGLGNTGDTHNNVFWDERLGSYVLFTRLYLGERLVARSQSKDFRTWEPPQLVVRSTLKEGKDRQCYCMPVFRYANGYLGFLMMYNVGTDRTVDCELAWSEDSVRWRRVLPGTPFLPRGTADSYDAGCVYAQANPPVLHDGKLHIYYGGSTATHTGWKRHCLPCLARLRVDGFAGYEPNGFQPGVVESQPMLCDGSPLRVSVDIKGGSLRAEVVGEAGYALADCEPLTADQTDGEVKWGGGTSLAALKGRTVRLRFVLDKARLYSFSGPKAVSAPVVAPEIRHFREPVPVSLTLPGSAAGAVRYTLDGTEPTDTSATYAKPFEVSATTTVKARFFPSGVNGGGPVTVAVFTRRMTWDEANPHTPKVVVMHTADFAADDEGWVGNDAVERRTDDRERKYLRITRESRPPFAYADAKASRGMFCGDLPTRYGGSGIEVSFAYRSATEATPTIELFAGDLAPWTFRPVGKVGKEWTNVRADFRYDWSDAEAMDAGWRRAPHAVSWQETVRAVGRVVVVQAPGPGGSFDLSGFRMTTRFE